MVADTTYSKEFENEHSCGFEEDHEIRTAFVDVLNRVRENTDYDVEYAATGCSTCCVMNADINIFWVAQHDATEFVYLNYGSDITQQENIAEMIIEAANELGISTEWDGSTQTAVKLVWE